MKFSILLVVFLSAYAVAQESDVSEEGIWSTLKDKVKDGWRKYGDKVVKVVFDKAAEIVTDKLHLKPTPEAKLALSEGPSAEGIFEHAADLILKRADELAAEYDTENPSHEAIFPHFGNFHKIPFAEDLIDVRYNSSIEGDFSHEGILGKLGGFAVNGIGKIIGGKAGKIISTAGDVIGSLFFAAPSATSTEGIYEDPHEEGIFSTAGKILTKGAAKLAGGLLKGAFDSLKEGIFGNILMARGSFSNYANIGAPARAILKLARENIDKFPKDSKYQGCLHTAEVNMSQIYEHYEGNSHKCVLSGEESSRGILDAVRDIVLDSVKRFEAGHRDTASCFDKGSADRFECLKAVPAAIEEHTKQVYAYGRELANYVSKFTLINNEFDVCLVGHLGYVRSEVYHVIDDFHRCIEHFE